MLEHHCQIEMMKIQSDREERTASLEGQLAALQVENEGLKCELESEKAVRAAQQQQLRDAEAEIVRLKAQLSTSEPSRPVTRSTRSKREHA